jgi:hypothetical protein
LLATHQWLLHLHLPLLPYLPMQEIMRRVNLRNIWQACL